MFVAFWFCLGAWGAQVSTEKFSEELQKSTRFCLQNYPAGKLSSQDEFERCLRQSLDVYYNDVVKAAWGTPKTPLVPATASPAASPTATPVSTGDRDRQEAALKSDLRQLVKSVRCQRCHVGMDEKQFTLAQFYGVLTTPSHRGHLGGSDALVKKIGEFLK